MKYFNRILLLGIMILSISGTTLAIKPNNPISPGLINNPGDKVTDIKQGESAVAGVPMEVRVNVLGQGPQLVLVDETGTLIETLKFDHGNKLLTKGTDDKDYLAQESKVEKIVIMKRTDGKAFGADESGNEEEASNKNYTGSFYAESHHPNDMDLHQMTLVKLGSSSDSEKHEIVSELEYKSTPEEIAGTEKEFRTTVVSIIKARTEAKPGLYIGTGIFAGSLTLEPIPLKNKNIK